MLRFGIVTAIFCIAVIGCKNPPPPVSKPGHVAHIVVCWLKSPGNEKDRLELIEVSKKFREIPGVLDVTAGRVLPSERPIVVSDFDVAIIMTFENQEAMQAYLEHPEHKKAVSETLKPLAQKILVYDFIIE